MNEYIKPIAIAVSILAIVIIIGYLSITKANLAADYAESQRSVEALTVANQAFFNQIEAANKAQKEREKEIVTALKKAEIATFEYNKLADKIQNEKPSNSDDCKAAISLINKYIAGAK